MPCSCRPGHIFTRLITSLPFTNKSGFELHSYGLLDKCTEWFHNYNAKLANDKLTTHRENLDYTLDKRSYPFVTLSIGYM